MVTSSLAISFGLRDGHVFFVTAVNVPTYGVEKYCDGFRRMYSFESCIV